MKSKDHNTSDRPENFKKSTTNADSRSETKNQVYDKAELLKKHKNEPDYAKENLDIPGARTARPLTNDRHPDGES
ncbi:hypothetical protein [Winogradskyella schleiferi]|uniref:hypothetical protein n=1 Tax=Winogradskyella schleiferi TaxID=2686078 RepID=UPI0015C0BFD7|nr:hypothetical protein [Winogradskyella schleiferi]